jgi:hypothetical protein
MSKHLLKAVTKLIFFRASDDQNSFWIALGLDNFSVPLYEGILPSTSIHSRGVEGNYASKTLLKLIYLVVLV